ncbi:PP2C family protein-serine/threonine phosphatase [Streptomyces lavendofoliae]|uniref:PP2C family protein-serine/threonine phosphatase n=1 Tax=Streptomyces lavendofoliae TaxID=67314 RepID=UPI00167431C9|nr:PP2C family protein-serine/threonine phosphatase [Streptomyces lavendofoliae]
MERFAAVERAVRDAPPHALLEAVRDVLATHYTAVSVDLLMADYAMTTLQPVSALPYTTEPLPVHGSAPGRAFGSQQPHVEKNAPDGDVIAHFPVSVRGDRVGVLTVRLPAGRCTPRAEEELQGVAQLLGREIVLAERETDLYLQARRTGRLTLAAEMQWQLLPGSSSSRPEYEIGAQLEPAYAIHGDNYDWSASADHLTLTVTNGMGEGVEAALLTNLAINALRNARRAGLSLADQACLADQAVHGHYHGVSHLAVLLLRFDLVTGEVEVVDAGSPRMWRLRQGKAEPIPFEAQLPLGMFEDTMYSAQRFSVEPGDRLFFLSDGVYDVASPAGERYGEKALMRAMTATRLLPPSQVPRAVLRELAGHRGTEDADDDALVVCLDWRGRR